MSIIKLAIVDDHQIVIDGLKLLLRDKKKFEIVAEATTAGEMLGLISQAAPDILITDIMMPVMDGFELSLKVRSEFPQIKILALSMSEDGHLIAKMIEKAKINGYIPKASGKQELIRAIESIIENVQYFAPQIIEQYEYYKKIKTDSELFHLTARELEIIDCMVKHLSNKEIAQKLFISERTVETHRKNIFRKTNTKGVGTLIEFIKKHKIFG